MSQVGGDCMCKGPEVRTTAFEEFQELGMAGVQGEGGWTWGLGSRRGPVPSGSQISHLQNEAVKFTLQR